MVAASYMFLRRFRRGSELDGSLMIASCAATIGFARAAATDMPLASMLSIALISWYAWRESNERRYLAAFYVFLGLRDAWQKARLLHFSQQRSFWPSRSSFEIGLFQGA